jgi:hypothetical protein
MKTAYQKEVNTYFVVLFYMISLGIIFLSCWFFSGTLFLILSGGVIALFSGKFLEYLAEKPSFVVSAGIHSISPVLNPSIKLIIHNRGKKPIYGYSCEFYIIDKHGIRDNITECFEFDQTNHILYPDQYHSYTINHSKIKDKVNQIALSLSDEKNIVFSIRKTNRSINKNNGLSEFINDLNVHDEMCSSKHIGRKLMTLILARIQYGDVPLDSKILSHIRKYDFSDVSMMSKWDWKFYYNWFMSKKFWHKELTKKEK